GVQSNVAAAGEVLLVVLMKLVRSSVGSSGFGLRIVAVNVNVLSGVSGSVADNGKVSCDPSLRVAPDTGPSTGGWFAVKRIVSKVVSEPSKALNTTLKL